MKATCDPSGEMRTWVGTRRSNRSSGRGARGIGSPRAERAEVVQSTGAWWARQAGSTAVRDVGANRCERVTRDRLVVSCDGANARGPAIARARRPPAAAARRPAADALAIGAPAARSMTTGSSIRPGAGCAVLASAQGGARPPARSMPTTSPSASRTSSPSLRSARSARRRPRRGDRRARMAGAAPRPTPSVGSTVPSGPATLVVSDLPWLAGRLAARRGARAARERAGRSWPSRRPRLVVLEPARRRRRRAPGSSPCTASSVWSPSAPTRPTCPASGVGSGRSSVSLTSWPTARPERASSSTARRADGVHAPVRPDIALLRTLPLDEDA